MNNVQLALTVWAAVLTWSGTVAGVVWFIAVQFSKTRAAFHARIDEHEKADEKRFDTLNLAMQRVELWTGIHGEHAAKMPPTFSGG